MTHPNVLTVYDCTVDKDETYIVSEYLNGLTLDNYIKRHHEPIDFEDFMHLAEQMLMGLSEAHKQGIIHGDLKPNNVVILDRSNNKQVKLLDFGLSQIMQNNDSEDKGKQSIQDSAYFMAPEEFDGTEKKCAF